MESSASNPSVDEVIQETERLIGGPVSCPCCENTDWATPADLFNMWGGPASFDPDAPGEIPGPGIYQALILVCRNCRFVRQHFVPVPEDEAEAA